MKTEDLRIASKKNREALAELQPYVDKINEIKLREQMIELILNPRFNICTHTDNKSGRRYFQAKVYWPDSNGNVTRSLSFGLGNVYDYPQGFNDCIGGEKIRNILMEKFGNLVS